jgi:hypothetical protein
MSVEVIDNFLDPSTFKEIQEIFLGSELPWNYYDFKVDQKESESKVLYQSQMVHIFYNHFSPGPYYPVVSPIIQKLEAASIIKIKANLTFPWNKVEKFSPHVDNGYIGTKTAVFYLNSNDGKTIFSGHNEGVESIENRMIIFPSSTLHYGTTHTNSKSRVVLNINFFDGR